MGVYKGPTEGGSGGKRGHSNMEHWTYTEELKESSRKQRRKEDKKEIGQGISDTSEKQEVSSKKEKHNIHKPQYIQEITIKLPLLT